MSKADPGKTYERYLAATQPKARRAHGVYYTPPYIVTHILNHTLGRWLADKTPAALVTGAGLRVLDPACGAGAFMAGAYQYLLNWYLAQYVETKETSVVEFVGDVWRLTRE